MNYRPNSDWTSVRHRAHNSVRLDYTFFFLWTVLFIFSVGLLGLFRCRYSWSFWITFRFGDNVSYGCAYNCMGCWCPDFCGMLKTEFVTYCEWVNKCWFACVWKYILKLSLHCLYYPHWTHISWQLSVIEPCSKLASRCSTLLWKKHSTLSRIVSTDTAHTQHTHTNINDQTTNLQNVIRLK